MHLPDDFGFSAVQTLAHVGDAAPGRNHSVFWNHVAAAIWAESPSVLPASGGDADPSDPTATERVLSIKNTRIGCRLLRPPSGTPVRALCVTTHGYSQTQTLAEQEQEWSELASRGVAVLLVRVRGYPGSQRDCGPLVTHPLGYITFGLDLVAQRPEDHLGWVIPQAAADVVNACRALRKTFTSNGVTPPLFLHGESFGGGLAVLAASILTLKDEGPARLAIALPTLGDWPWRVQHVKPGGPADTINEQVWRVLIGARERQPQIEHTLRLADAVVHAPRVRCPSLCKLATRDDIVPAPAAAAVYNGLGTDTGRKWRFVVPQGHFEGGLKNARRHALFTKAMHDFLDPRVEAHAGMARWESILSDGEREPAHVNTAPALFPGATLVDTDQVLADAYAAEGRTLDDLPYTAEFGRICERVAGAAVSLSAREVLHRLHTLRKAGKMPKVGRSETTAIRVNTEEEATLSQLVVAAVGSLGQRDRLPLTPEFDAIVERFNTSTGRTLTPHDVWRLVAKLAK